MLRFVQVNTRIALMLGNVIHLNTDTISYAQLTAISACFTCISIVKYTGPSVALQAGIIG